MYFARKGKKRAAAMANLKTASMMGPVSVRAILMATNAEPQMATAVSMAALAKALSLKIFFLGVAVLVVSGMETTAFLIYLSSVYKYKLNLHGSLVSGRNSLKKRFFCTFISTASSKALARRRRNCRGLI